MATLKNKAGNLVLLGSDSIKAATKQSEISLKGELDISDSAHSESWPLAYTSYVAMHAYVSNIFKTIF